MPRFYPLWGEVGRGVCNLSVHRIKIRHLCSDNALFFLSVFASFSPYFYGTIASLRTAGRDTGLLRYALPGYRYDSQQSGCRAASGLRSRELVASEVHDMGIYKKYKEYYGYVFYIGKKI